MKLTQTGYEVSIITHYVAELELLYKFNYDIYYSYEPDDYFDILGQFDAIVGLRLHGCLLSLSLGKPAIVIPHEPRVMVAAKEVPLLIISSIEEVQSKLSFVSSTLDNWKTRHESFLDIVSNEYVLQIKNIIHPNI